MDITNLGIAAMPAITILCLLIAQGVKATAIDNKWLPVICGLCGAVLGVVGMFTMPDFPAHDLLTSAAVGVVSGFAATGAHQVVKQLKQ